MSANIDIIQVAAATPSFRRQLMANGIGRIWGFLSNFVFVPLYLRILGIDSFAVIALFIAVGGIVAFLDLGLTPTMARELNDQQRNLPQKINLLFSYEIAYLAIVGLIILIALVVPPNTFSILLSQQDLARHEVASSVRLVFICAAGLMLFNFYVAGLMGVEEQVRGNLIIVVAGIIRSALVIVPLWFYPQPLIYLVWQLVFLTLFAIIARRLLYKCLDRQSQNPQRGFSLNLITQNLPFTTSMFLVALISTITAQIDKIFIGRIKGISSLAEYSLASTFAQLLVFMISPITITLLPRLVRSVTSGDVVATHRLFSFAHKIVCPIVCATVSVLVFFGPSLVDIWTGGNLDSASIASYFTPLALGYALLALQMIPYSIAVANKDLSAVLLYGGVSAALTLPAYWILITRLGIPGAAWTWLLLQIVLYPLYIRWVNRRFIGMQSLWSGLLIRSLLLPLIVAFAVSYLGSRLLTQANNELLDVTIAVCTTLISLFSCFAISLRRLDFHRLLTSPSTNQL